MPLGTSSALNQIVHTHLQGSLTRAYPSWVAIEELTETQGDDYSIVETYEPVVSLAALRGILAAAGADEIRKAEMTNIKITHVLDLQSYHPEIGLKWRVQVSRKMGETGEYFNVTGIKHDSQASYTRLELEKVSH